MTARTPIAGILQGIPGLRYLAVPSHGPLTDSNAIRTATAPGSPAGYNPDTGAAGPTAATDSASVSYSDAIRQAMIDAGSNVDDPADPGSGGGFPMWGWIAIAALGGLVLAGRN